MWLKETKFSVRLGGNTFTNCPVLIRYKDEPLFSLVRSEDGLLAINLQVYDAARRKIATVKHNTIYFGDQSAFSLEGDADRLALIAKASGAVLVDIRKRAAATAAELDVSVRTYLPNGRILDLGPNSTNVGGVHIGHIVIDGCAVGIQIDRPTSELQPVDSRAAK